MKAYLVDDMCDAVLEDQISLCDLPAVNVVPPTADANGEYLAALCG